MPEPDSSGKAESTSDLDPITRIDSPDVPREQRVVGKGATKVLQGPDVVRSVTSISFSDPFTALLSDELTYENRTASSIDSIEIAKGEHKMDREASREASLLANLKFFDQAKSRLELLPGYGAESDKLTVILKQPIQPRKQQTIYMEYAHTFRHRGPSMKGRLNPRTLLSRMLFKEPKFEFPFHIGQWSTYVNVQPAPRLQLKFDKKRSTVPAIISTRIGPEQRNALNLRIDRFPKNTTELENILLDFWSERGVEVIPGAFPHFRVKKFQARKWWFAVLSFLVPRKKVKDFVFKHYQEELTTITEQIIDKREVRVRVRQSLPGSLKSWLYVVFVVALGSAFFSPSVTVSASAIALLAITRSWLFYEEEMMKPAGYAALTLFILNFLGIFALAVFGMAPYSAYKEGLAAFLKWIR